MHYNRKVKRLIMPNCEYMFVFLPKILAFLNCMHLVMLIRLSTLQLLNISSHLQLLLKPCMILQFLLLDIQFSSIWHQIQFVSKFTNDGCIIILSLSSCWESLVNYEDISWLVVGHDNVNLSWQMMFSNVMNKKFLDLVRFILHHHKLPIRKKIFHPTHMCFKHTTSMCKSMNPWKNNFHTISINKLWDGKFVMAI